MDNFLDFIKEDISTKKTLLSTMPTKTKTNIKKFNEKIDIIINSYVNYEKHVKRYIVTKSDSFSLNPINSNVDDITNEVARLEHVRFLLNPTNSYFEKMGFDNLLFEIRNYSDFNFEKLNEIIDNFLKKFELAGIILESSNFNYTYYVKEYMTAFLENKKNTSNNFDALNGVFEKIYWENPEIIEHIEISFRKLIRKHHKKFDNYINKLQKDVMLKTSINSYQECLEKLRVVYFDLAQMNKENIHDIINMAKSGKIDIKNYSPDSRVCLLNYEAVMIDTLELKNVELKNKFHDRLEKFKKNIEEYQSLLKFIPLFDDFKNNYEQEIKNSNKSISISKSKALLNKINDMESKLDRLNKTNSTNHISFFELKNNESKKQSKLDAVNLAKKLYSLYKEYDQELFKETVLDKINISYTIPELLHLYYSYDYFKKIAIQKVFKLTSYNDVMKQSEAFDLFAMNPNNVIINGVSVFSDNSLAKIIVNKYRLDNINVSEESLEVDNLNLLLTKINFLMRVNEIENSNTSVDKIWFMTEVERILKLQKQY